MVYSRQPITRSQPKSPMTLANQTKFDAAAQYARTYLTADAGAYFQLRTSDDITAAEHSLQLFGPGHDDERVAYNQVMTLTMDGDGAWSVNVDTLDTKGNAYPFEAASTMECGASFEDALNSGEALAEQQMDTRELEVENSLVAAMSWPDTRGFLKNELAREQGVPAPDTLASMQRDIEDYAQTKNVTVRTETNRGEDGFTVYFPDQSWAYLGGNGTDDPDSDNFDPDVDPELVITDRHGATMPVTAKDIVPALGLLKAIVAEYADEQARGPDGVEVSMGRPFTPTPPLSSREQHSPMSLPLLALIGQAGERYSREHQGTMQVLAVKADESVPGAYRGQMAIDTGWRIEQVGIGGAGEALTLADVLSQAQARGANFYYQVPAHVLAVDLKDARHPGDSTRNADVLVAVASTEYSVAVTLDRTGKHVGFTQDGAKSMEAVLKAAGWLSMPRLLGQLAEAVQTTFEDTRMPVRGEKPRERASLAR